MALASSSVWRPKRSRRSLRPTCSAVSRSSSRSFVHAVIHPRASRAICDGPHRAWRKTEMDILNMQMMLLPLVWPLLLGGLFLHVIPDLARPELFFGVTVDPRFRQSELARGIRRRYSMAIWIATLIAVALAVTAAF